MSIKSNQDEKYAVLKSKAVNEKHQKCVSNSPKSRKVIGSFTSLLFINLKTTISVQTTLLKSSPGQDFAIRFYL